MNTAAIAPQFVHESEAQRQFARVRMPARLFVKIDGTMMKFPVADVSAGGVSIHLGHETLRQGRVYSGRLVFKIDGFDFAVDVNFVPRNMGDRGDRCGCEFQDLGANEVSVLRYLITSFLSGELVSVGDMLNTLSRENFTKSRKSKATQALGFFASARAMLVSLVVMGLGLIAVTFIGYQLWQIYFVTTAESAMVASENIPVRVPKDAKVTTLVEAGEQVEAGQAIATFDAPMLSYVNELVGNGNYTVEQIEELLGQSVRGTLTSPCDCKVLNLLPAQDQYMSKGEQLAVVAPTDATAHVIARFNFAEGESLEEGQSVTLRLPGGKTQPGRIESLFVDAEAPNQPGSAINALIRAQEALPMESVGRPIGVTVDVFQLDAVDGLIERVSQI
ncbi:alginate biosynthesis protein Alg44 [Marinobacter nauticus]|uniref:alginate biosynthesis protein Alg44 n=1 Tax=Marinobacter nauticus TaxID=2743 RepID=UPI001A8D27D7|nr:alginate biosynthesis protein Alg44 [Marinobacter nauticus]MBN8240675.1 alginate biosynthesis protein Alg44 [Marinobacter nauticus]MCC4271407.1 alginate biosynthesis protein Alg44 [Marinobacter nauticus]